jgi:hypothetical protein
MRRYLAKVAASHEVSVTQGDPIPDHRPSRPCLPKRAGVSAEVIAPEHLARTITLLQYLADERGPEIVRMVEGLVCDVEVIPCQSEVDALLHEARLVKTMQFRQLATRTVLAAILGGSVGVAAAMEQVTTQSLAAAPTRPERQPKASSPAQPQAETSATAKIYRGIGLAFIALVIVVGTLVTASGPHAGDAEVARLLNQVEVGVERPRQAITFEIGEQVKVTEGPFESFTGMVEEVDENSSRIKVMVSIFGRPTPVELEYYRNGGILHTVLRNLMK